jgi:ABC-type Fe3+ transport system substrate-binding protein
MFSPHRIVPTIVALTLLLGTACAPAAPAPTAAPPSSGEAKPAAAKPAEPAAPAPKPAESAVPAAKPAEPAQKPAAASSSAALTQLIEGAKKESELNIVLPSTARPEMIASLEAAFNQTYGLNIRIKSKPAGNYVTNAGVVVTEHKSGTPPSFDTTLGFEDQIMTTQVAGALEPMDNWLELLPPGTPNNDPTTSPSILKGTAFKFTDQTHVVVYNTSLISESQLPKTTEDLGKPEFKGKISVPEATGNLSMLILVKDNEKVLETYRAWAKNEPKVLGYNDAVSRLVLGELSVVPFPNEYDYFLQKEKGGPVGMTVLRDFVQVTPNYMAVRKNAKSPNAAKLWVLFNTSPQANKIWFDSVRWMNTSYPNDQLRELQKLLQDTGAKTVSWLRDEESTKKLEWIASPEGQAFQERVGRIVRGQE